MDHAAHEIKAVFFILSGVKDMEVPNFIEGARGTCRAMLLFLVS